MAERDNIHKFPKKEEQQGQKEGSRSARLAVENEGPELPLTPIEKKSVKELQRANAIVLHEVIRKEGQRELERTFSSLMFSALAAGLSMGFSLVGEGLLAAMLPDEPWRPVIAKLGYSLGFLFVILGRQQLFTENTITAVLPALHNKDLRTFRKLLRMWAIVFSFNVIGACVFALVVAKSAVFTEAAKHEFARMAMHQVDHGFGTEMLKAVFAGWLIAFMVWMLPSVENSRIALIVIVTYVVGLGSLAHIIAGSVEASYGVWAGVFGWGEMVAKFLIPTLLGNIIGGVTLVAGLNKAQVDFDFAE
jgi:formate-nitrite transporter family protein